MASESEPIWISNPSHISIEYGEGTRSIAGAFIKGAGVSRVLYLLAKAMTISLDESLPTASSNLPEFQLVRAAPGSLA